MTPSQQQVSNPFRSQQILPLPMPQLIGNYQTCIDVNETRLP
jgi:hypothetical protein